MNFKEPKDRVRSFPRIFLTNDELPNYEFRQFAIWYAMNEKNVREFRILHGSRVNNF